MRAHVHGARAREFSRRGFFPVRRGMARDPNDGGSACAIKNKKKAGRALVADAFPYALLRHEALVTRVRPVRTSLAGDTVWLAQPSVRPVDIRGYIRGRENICVFRGSILTCPVGRYNILYTMSLGGVSVVENGGKKKLSPFRRDAV